MNKNNGTTYFQQNSSFCCDPLWLVKQLTRRENQNVNLRNKNKKRPVMRGETVKQTQGVASEVGMLLPEWWRTLYYTCMSTNVCAHKLWPVVVEDWVQQQKVEDGGGGGRGGEGGTWSRLIRISLALDPVFRIHSHKTLDTAQPFHLLKPNWKPSSSHSIFIPTNISTQFLLQSVCVCVCVCVCVVRVCLSV